MLNSVQSFTLPAAYFCSCMTRGGQTASIQRSYCALPAWRLLFGLFAALSLAVVQLVLWQRLTLRRDSLNQLLQPSSSPDDSSPGGAGVQQRTYFVAANFHNSASTLSQFTEELLLLCHVIGKQHVFVSVYENG